MKKTEFITSFLTFYLKGEITSDSKFVKVKFPNTILGFIPLGSTKRTIAINQISSVDTSFSFQGKTFLAGLIFLIIGLCTIAQGIGVIGLLLGIIGILNSLQTLLSINTTDGGSVIVSFIIFEKDKAEKVEEEINELIGNRLDDTNGRKQTDRVVDAINKK